MATTPNPERRPGRAEAPPEPERPALGNGAHRPTREDEPRIVAERRSVDPYGDEHHEVVDEYGRRFYSFRPRSPERYDVFGFGWFWWLIFWLVIIGLIVWGWGWGWGY